MIQKCHLLENYKNLYWGTFFYRYRVLCMLYILSEITFSFYFWRYKIVRYTHNLILLWFQILYPSFVFFFFKLFFTHYTPLYFFCLLPSPSHFPFVRLCHCHMGRDQIVSNFLPVKLLWKISHSYTRGMNSFRKKRVGVQKLL